MKWTLVSRTVRGATPQTGRRNLAVGHLGLAGDSRRTDRRSAYPHRQPHALSVCRDAVQSRCRDWRIDHLPYIPGAAFVAADSH